MKKTLLLALTIFAGFFATAQNAENALDFDGTDDYVLCPLPSLFTDLTNNSFTFEAWIKRESGGRIFYAQLDASNFATVLLNNGYMLYYVKRTNLTSCIFIPIPTASEWNHVAFTWGGSNGIQQIYVNGVLQVTGSGGASSSGTDNRMTIGARSDGAQPFMGQMDEVRIWNTVRDACQIRSMMNSTPTGAEADLVSYYNFNRGTADGNNPAFTTLPDIVGTNDGALNNFALTGTSSNWITSGAAITAEGPQPAYSTAVSQVICAGDSYVLGTQTLTSPGTYQELFVSADGCDSLVTLDLDVHDIPETLENVTTCIAYTWPQNGVTYTVSGTYGDTLTGQYGCDSIVLLNLTIAQPSYGTVQSMAACESYTWTQNGQTYTASGIYTDTIANTAGCDSILTLDLTINLPTYGTVQNMSACGSYTWPQNGQTYTANGTYTDTIANTVGCDSIITLALTINVPVYGPVLTASACGSYLWLQNGQTYTVSGSYTDTVTSVSGCDSILTLNATINNGYTETQNVSYCGTSYYWPVTQTVYTVEGVYVANLTGVNGCDSSLTLDLQLNAFPEAEIIHAGDGTLVGAASGAVVEDWIDCGTGQSIPGQQGIPTFTPAQNGNYAVVVSNPLTSCADTSDCYAFSMLGVNELSAVGLHIAPNPATDRVKVAFTGETALLTIRDAQGKLLAEEVVSNGQELFLEQLQAGVYLFCVQVSGAQATQRIVKQ